MRYAIIAYTRIIVLGQEFVVCVIAYLNGGQYLSSVFSWSFFFRIVLWFGGQCDISTLRILNRLLNFNEKKHLSCFWNTLCFLWHIRKSMDKLWSRWKRQTYDIYLCYWWPGICDTHSLRNVLTKDQIKTTVLNHCESY